MVRRKLEVAVVRGVDYDAAFDKMIYRATVRVYVRSAGEEHDISVVRLRSTTPQGLELKIQRMKRRFERLQKTNPKFFEKIGIGETITDEE